MKKLVFLILAGAIVFGVYILYKKPGNGSLITPRLVDFIDFPQKEKPAEYVRSLKAVVVSLPSDPDKKENMDNIKSIIEKALEDDIDLKLIVFGEASLGTYSGGKEYQKKIAEPIPGPFTQMLSYYTMHYNIYIAVGLIEKKGDKLYNSLAVVDPLGSVTVHRKAFLHQIDVDNGITEAEPNCQVVAVDRFRFGLAICADINDKRLFDLYKKENLDGIICPVSSEVPWISKWLNCWPYSKLYNAWILAANRSGKEGEENYEGTVFVSSPRGYLNYSDNPSGHKLVAVIGK